MTQVFYGVTLFFSSFIETFPFLVLGAGVSSFLLVFVNQSQWRSRFPKNPFFGAIFGSGLGLLFPLGQYGTIPIARRLLWQGVSLPITISFLIASPTLNPWVLWVSWRTLGAQGYGQLWFWRILIMIAIAIIVGCLFGFYVVPRQPQVNPDTLESAIVSPQQAPALGENPTLVTTGSTLFFLLPYQPLQEMGTIIYDPLRRDGTTLPQSEKWRLFIQNFVSELREWASLLAIACLLTTTIQLVFPPTQILALSQSSMGKILTLGLLSMILSLGSISNSALALSLLPTFSGASVLGFLLFGSILDVKTLTLILGSLRLKIAVYALVITLQLILLSSLIVDFGGYSLIR